MQYNVFGSKHRSNVPKKIVEVRNKHGNGDEFPDFADLFCFFSIKNVRVGGNILGSVGRSETHLFFFWPNVQQLPVTEVNNINNNYM
jgi:hypothetical protein